MRTRESRRAHVALAAAALLAAGCGSAPAGPVPAPREPERRTAPEVPPPRLLAGLEGYSRPVRTSSPEAGRWFDQGLLLLYGFNHDEALRSFQQVVALDPDCVMGWWGIAQACGIHINVPFVSEELAALSADAVREACARFGAASPVERALVHAAAARSASPPPDDRLPLEEAYAEALEKAWRAFPDDPDVGTLFAESLMNLQPWDYWEPADGTPIARATEIREVLERVLELSPDHPGASHFYIHLMEASETPEAAEAVADRLVERVPGAGHLEHMPGHIYARVGRYADASDANVRAIAADRAYLPLAPEPERYAIYVGHNFMFLAFTSMMEGRYGAALEAARSLFAEIPEELMPRVASFLDPFLTAELEVSMRFGRWEELLALPAPPDYRPYSRAFHRYARGVALSALGRTAEAREELAAFEVEAARVPAEWSKSGNPCSDLLEIARHVLEGELAYREGRHEEAFATLREGIALEDALGYMEPPSWGQPVRHALGALLMGVGRAPEAERVYRADLARNPGNGWALLGLEQALTAQGKDAEAAEQAALRRRAWPRADVEPTSSCYCQPAR